MYRLTPDEKLLSDVHIGGLHQTIIEPTPSEHVHQTSVSWNTKERPLFTPTTFVSIQRETEHRQTIYILFQSRTEAVLNGSVRENRRLKHLPHTSNSAMQYCQRPPHVLMEALVGKNADDWHVQASWPRERTFGYHWWLPWSGSKNKPVTS